MSLKESLTNGFLDRSLKIYIASAITIFIFVLTITINRVEEKVKEVNSKLFTHLTNESLHVPREQIVSQNEFIMHCKFAQENKTDILKILDKIQDDVKTILRKRR